MADRPRRVYERVEVALSSGGFAILLDGKPAKTPAKAALAVPSRALAEAIAAEWRAQGQRVDPNTMPLTRIASIALDLVMPRRAAVIAEIVKYGGTDLVCYRAEHPAALAQRQDHAWQPLVEWARARFGAELAVTSGVVPTEQPARSLRALGDAVVALPSLELAALHLATAACGSLVVALALAEGRIDAEAAFAAAELDATFEIERWGQDDEQTRRRAALRADIEAAARFLSLVAA